jgi:ribosomal protein S21
MGIKMEVSDADQSSSDRFSQFTRKFFKILTRSGMPREYQRSRVYEKPSDRKRREHARCVANTAKRERERRQGQQ